MNNAFSELRTDYKPKLFYIFIKYFSLQPISMLPYSLKESFPNEKIAKRINMSEIYNTTIFGHSIMGNAII